MGIKAIALVEKAGLNTGELLEKLNKLYCDEWFSYIQYWTGAKVSTGAFNAELTAEMKEHAEEEFKHAEMLAKRIIELEGVPVLEPKDWYHFTNCGYLAPTNPRTQELLKQNLASERCAIQAYDELIQYVKGKDPVTYSIAVSILAEEIDHEQDLQNIQSDMDNA